MEANGKYWLIFSGIFSLVGIVCLIIAFFNYYGIQKFVREGIETEGTVIGHHKKRQISPGTALGVVVAYKDQNGQALVYYSTTYTTPVEYQIGEQVRIWYKRNQPNEVIIKGKNMWLITMVLGGFGIVFSLIGLPAFLKEIYFLWFNK